MSLSDTISSPANPGKYVTGLFEQHLSLKLEWRIDNALFSRLEPDIIRLPQYRGP